MDRFAFFIAAAFGLTWALAGLLFALRPTVEAALGPLSISNPSFFIAVWGPAIAALLTIARFDGRDGLRRYLRRVISWRSGAAWYLVVVLGWPCVFWVGGLMVQEAPARASGPLLAVLLAGLTQLLLDPGPMEEVGWRGYALPLLQARYSALAASLILGFLWGIWHLPAFLIEGSSQAGYAFSAFVVGSMSISVLMTALYNRTYGCIPLMFLFHWSLNDPFGFGKMAVQVPLLAFTLVAAAAATFFLGARNLGPLKFTAALGAAAPSHPARSGLQAEIGREELRVDEQGVGDPGQDEDGDRRAVR